MSEVRESDARLGHFDSDEHALATGVILGALVKASAEENILVEARPFMDGRDYTKQILVQVGDKHFTVTVEEATWEVLRE